jgi:hypothetical protein
MTPDQLRESLEAIHVQLVAETPQHYLVTRGNCIALIDRCNGSVGSTGMLTEDGLAYLVYRDNLPFLKSKAAETKADDTQVSAIRGFSLDLQSALR